MFHRALGAVTALVTALMSSAAMPAATASSATVSTVAADATKNNTGNSTDPAFPGINATDGDLRVSVDSIAPTTMTATSGTLVKVTVHNDGETDLTGTSVSLEVGKSALDSRASQKQWVTGSGGLSSGAATTSVPVPDVAAGASTSVTVSLTSSSFNLTYAAATLPIRIALQRDTTTLASWRSTVPYHADDSTTSSITPVKGSIIVPITLPADSRLLTATGTERVNAWRDAIGPGSRIDKLLSTSTSAPITWLIDPAVLDPAAAQDPTLPEPAQSVEPKSGGDQGADDSASDSTSSPSANSSGSGTQTSESNASKASASASESSASESSAAELSTAEKSSAASSDSPSTPSAPSASSTSNDSTTSTPTGSNEPSDSTEPNDSTSGTDTVEALAAQLRAKLKNRPDTQQVWFTPYGDPDISALTGEHRPAGAQDALQRALAQELPENLTDISTTVVAAPAEPLSQTATTRLRAAWKHSRPTEPLILTPNATLDGTTQGAITDSARRSMDGATFAGYDAGLSSLLDASTDTDASAARSARAQTMAIYQERPSTTRSLMLMADRYRTTASRLEAVADALDASDWVELTTPSSADAAKAKADVRLQPVAPQSADVYPRFDKPVVNRTDLTAISEALSTLTKIAPSLVNGDNVVPMWSQNLEQILSLRWRGHPAATSALSKQTTDNIQTIPTLVSVVPSQINFFTDSGKITVTVKNQLARGVKTVNLKLTPRAYSLHFRQQPASFSIPALSQAGVRVETVAQSAGVVSVTTSLTGQNGFDLGPHGTDDGTVTINARPTSSWIFWALGIVALAIFCYGLLRNRQKGTRRRDELARDIKL